MENKSLADIFDSYINWLVISIFLMALNLAFEAIAYLTPEATGNTLNALAQWLAYGSLIALAVAAIIWFRLPRDRRRKQNRVALLDGFVVEIAKRSAAIAFLLPYAWWRFLMLSPIPRSYLPTSSSNFWPYH